MSIKPRTDQVLDEYNRPIAGASIYVTDTVTLADASLTSDGITPLPQPVVTDEFGFFTYYAEEGIYEEAAWYGGKLRYKGLAMVGTAPTMKGDPGGNIMAIGLFTGASGLTIPTGTNVVRTAGYSVNGLGVSDYVADVAVDAAYVTAHPRTSFVSANGRGFRLVSTRFLSTDQFGVLADNTADDGTALQTAIDFAAGKTLYLQKGIAKHSNTLTFHKRSAYVGAGHDPYGLDGTVLLYTGTGDGCALIQPINSSTYVNSTFSDLTFKNANVNAGKGCFADTGSADLKFIRCQFIGSDRGLILDQSELVDVIDCVFESVTGQTCLAWLANTDRTAGTLGGYTNRISFQRCQFNGLSTVWGIIDDGGTAHVFADNNYNGTKGHIRFCAADPCVIRGGEFESASGDCITMSVNTLAGTAAGGSTIEIQGGQFSATVGHAAVNAITGGAGSLAIGGGTGLSGGGGTAPIKGGGNLAQLWLGMRNNRTSAAPTLYDVAPSTLYDTASPGGTAAMVATSPAVTVGVPRIQMSYEAGDFGLIDAEWTGDGWRPIHYNASEHRWQWNTLDRMILTNNALELVESVSLKIAGVKVLGDQVTGIPANATDLASAITLVNALKAALATHGLAVA